jgi:hypothetical protein
MNEPDVRAALLDAVPDLPTPADRQSEVRRRALRRRVLRQNGTLFAILLAVAMVGGSLWLLSNTRRPPEALPYIVRSPQTATGHSPTPGPARPTKSGPLIFPGFCPATLVLVPPLGADEVSDGTGVAHVVDVTICRYRQASFDLSVGTGVLVVGPRSGDPAAISAALTTLLQPPPSPGNTEGCRYPSPQSDIIVDIVYVIDVNDRAASYELLRITCQNPWLDDPRIPLQREVDRVLGPPY